MSWFGSARRDRTCAPDRAMLSRPWREAELCVVDVETTGLDLARDTIVAVGAVPVVHGRLRPADSMSLVVRPECSVSARSVEIHGLRPMDLVDAPTSTEAMTALLELLRGRLLVAHAAWIEYAFLRRALRDIGVRIAGPVLDTALLARRLDLVPAVPGYEPALSAVAVALGFTAHAEHDALGDALTTAEVAMAMLSRLPAGPLTTVVTPQRDLR